MPKTVTLSHWTFKWILSFWLKPWYPCKNCSVLKMIAKVSNKKDNVFIKYRLAKFWWELIVSSLLSFYLFIRWPKYWSFSFSISPSNGYSELISLRMGWLNILAIQGALNSLVQHYSLKTSVLRCSAYFIVQLSHPYMTTGKNSFDQMDVCWQNNVSAFK